MSIDLFKGIAVIIDDEINDAKANITKIVNQIEENNIPVLKYNELPHVDQISNFKNISFLLLDWRLLNAGLEDVDTGVILPAGLLDYDATSNIEFLKRLKEVCFCPIFIFTNDSLEEIEQRLTDEGLYQPTSSNVIMLRQKKSLTGNGKLIRNIVSWLKENPSIYLLKEWEREYNNSKNLMFSDFYKMSPKWPNIMWNNYISDGANQSKELGMLISQNLQTRMTPFEFSEDILGKKSTKKLSKKEIVKVIEGQLYLSNDRLHSNDIAPGDVFYIDNKYFLNIRPACDLVPNRNTNSLIEDVELYLLRGQKNGRPENLFDSKYGHIPERENQIIVFPIDGGKCVDFSLKNLTIKKWGELSEFRIGRVLPPKLVKIQQKCSAYLQREGLPRIPKEAF